ncbi:MAG TPA: hypothetical protein VGV09_11430, partial [Steroidobacteraceae bacterium]|nr:hypothetical protein [Steroidobacteraceae bacterium]
MLQARPYHLATYLGYLMLAGVAGCSAVRVHDTPPPNYSIAGMWELNPALSSDEAKVLASLQPKPRGERKGRGNGAGSGPGDKPAPEVINDPTTDLPPIDLSNGGRYAGAYGRPSERDTYRPPLDFQNNALLGGQWLKIRQTDTEVSIVNAATSRSYTPGEHSVVSVSSGVADQDSGWSGRNYLIYLKPQIGPSVKETYTLSTDGRQLLVKIEVGSEGRNQAIKVTRTYDRSTRNPDS